MATTTLKDRLREAMAYAGVNQKALEDKAKLTKGYMSRPLSGGRERVDPAILQRIADACDVSYTWLATGRGTMSGAPADRDAPRETTLEPEDVSPADVDDAQSPLEAALGQAFSSERHTLRDVDAVRSALRSMHAKQDVDGDLVEAARVWLDAAAAMRRRKEQVTTESLLVRVTLGKSSAHGERVVAERNATLNHEARERAKAAGMLPPDDDSEPTK